MTINYETVVSSLPRMQVFVSFFPFNTNGPQNFTGGYSWRLCGIWYLLNMPETPEKARLRATMEGQFKQVLDTIQARVGSLPLILNSSKTSCHINISKSVWSPNFRRNSFNSAGNLYMNCYMNSRGLLCISEYLCPGVAYWVYKKSHDVDEHMRLSRISSGNVCLFSKWSLFLTSLDISLLLPEARWSQIVAFPLTKHLLDKM